MYAAQTGQQPEHIYCIQYVTAATALEVKYRLGSKCRHQLRKEKQPLLDKIS